MMRTTTYVMMRDACHDYFIILLRNLILLDFDLIWSIIHILCILILFIYIVVSNDWDLSHNG